MKINTDNALAIINQIHTAKTLEEGFKDVAEDVVCYDWTKAGVVNGKEALLEQIIRPSDRAFRNENFDINYNYSFNLILPCSAGREAVERKARRAGNGASLPSGVTPRATASRPARREPHSDANTALQPLTRARHSLRAAPCLDAAVWL